MTAPLGKFKATTLDGKYALVREIGSGGAGTVYEAEHLVVGKRVAIKVLHAVAEDVDARGRAVSEARAAARIAHANVVDIHDLGITPDGVPYLVMELLQGQTVAELVERHGAQPAGVACEIVLQMLAGLSAAHRNGIVHCDLKPANVMVTHPSPEQPLVKVLDFGIARPLVESVNDSATIALGTPMYMAPEQVAGEPIDERTDVYASAVILYVLVTGRSPFNGKTTRELMQKVARGEFQPVLESNPDVPKALAAIIESGMQRKRRERIGSAEELAEKLRAFLNSSFFSSLSSKRKVTAQNASILHRTRPVPDKSRPPQSSVVRVELSPRLVTDSLLMSPRLPKPPGSPRLEAGRDFMPMLGDPSRDRDREQRQLSTAVPRPASALPAVVATLVGFAAGVILAWTAGLI